jgi:predicted transposase/invertase (TIGR01784 family)
LNEQYFIDPAAEILPAKDDRIFKSLLTRSEPESKIVLMDVIGSVIGRKVTDVVIKNNEPATTDVSQKQERLDVNCEIDGREIVNIEMQSSHIREIPDTEHRNLKNKSVFYGCDLFSSQSIKGRSYAELVKTYQITFVAYTIFPKSREYRSEFKLRSENGDVLTNDLAYIFIELSKLKEVLEKPVEEMTALEMWSIFFECADNRSYRKVINEIIRVKEEIQMASTLLQSISQDDYEKARFLSKRKFENDLESDKNTIRKIEKYEFARRMLLKDKPIDEIIEFTDLTENEINDIRKTLL